MISREDFIWVNNRFFELKKLSNDELNSIGLSFGLDFRPYKNRLETKYQLCSKFEKIFWILEEENKKEAIR